MINSAHDESMLPNHHFIVATRIAEHGIDARHDEVVRYIAALRRAGNDDGGVRDIAADPSHSGLAEGRTFGRLLSHLGRHRAAHAPAHAA